LKFTGEILTAVQSEERFSRKKHDARFPGHASAHCLKAGGLALTELTDIVF
jgi:carbamoyltransferase